jgi:tRNA threonylcarbamoyladenosine modification (KEOPS) complex Cgi121 subunit
MMQFVRIASRFASVEQLMDSLAELRARKKCFLQAFDAAAIVSEGQLVLAYENAELAFKEKRKFAEKLEAEVLGRAAGTRKIKEAIGRVGVKDAANVVVMFEGAGKAEVLAGLGAKELKPTFAPDGKEVAKRFGLSGKALAAYHLEKLVLERVAMAGVE